MGKLEGGRVIATGYGRKLFAESFGKWMSPP